MPNAHTKTFEGLCRTSDRMIDPCEHRYLKELATADQIDVWKIKDILDRCVCYALASGFVIVLLDVIMREECKAQNIPLPTDTRLNLLEDEPHKRPPYDDEDTRLARERKPEQEIFDDQE